MISIEQGITYSITTGILIGIIWGARKIVTLEKVILRIDQNMKDMLKRVEKEEHRIEKEEHRIENKISRK